MQKPAASWLLLCANCLLGYSQAQQCGFVYLSPKWFAPQKKHPSRSHPGLQCCAINLQNQFCCIGLFSICLSLPLVCVRAEKVFGEFLSWDLEEASSRLPLKSGQAVTLTVHIKVELDFSGQESLLQDLNDGEWSGTFSANYKRGASVPRAGCHGNGDRVDHFMHYVWVQTDRTPPDDSLQTEFKYSKAGIPKPSWRYDLLPACCRPRWFS